MLVCMRVCVPRHACIHTDRQYVLMLTLWEGNAERMCASIRLVKTSSMARAWSMASVLGVRRHPMHLQKQESKILSKRRHITA